MSPNNRFYETSAVAKFIEKIYNEKYHSYAPSKDTFEAAIKSTDYSSTAVLEEMIFTMIRNDPKKGCRDTGNT